MEISLVCAAACVGLTAHGRVERVGVGLGAVAETPVRATPVEEILRGAVPDEALIAEAAGRAADVAAPIDDVRGTAEYRRDMLQVVVRRALRAAVGRARAHRGGAG